MVARRQEPMLGAIVAARAVRTAAEESDGDHSA